MSLENDCHRAYAQRLRHALSGINGRDVVLPVADFLLHTIETCLSGNGTSARRLSSIVLQPLQSSRGLKFWHVLIRRIVVNSNGARTLTVHSDHADYCVKLVALSSFEIVD